MNNIDFEDSNVKIAENQEEYRTLYALRLGDKADTTVTCWGLSIKERLKVLFTGRIWMSEMNFGRSFTPRYMSVERKDVYSKDTD